MNNLKKIMELRKITAIELAAVSGVSVTNIRRIMGDPEVTPYRGTVGQLAHALCVSEAEILGERAPGNNNNLLTKRVVDAAEELLQALRTYTAEPLILVLTADTDDNRPDALNYYAAHIEDMDGKYILNKAAYVKFNGQGERVFIHYLQDERRGQ